MTWKNSPLDGLAWIVADGLTAYPEALAFMEARAAEIHAGTAPETVWLVEHPPLYTSGTSARPDDLVAPGRFPVYEAGRGGQYTYHGPGQRVGYVMIDLNRRGGDVRAYVRHLEEWIIRTLQRFNVKGERREGRGGICEDKIGALGVRVRRGVTFHGISLNVDCDLSHFGGIVPCGISAPAYGVTSLADLGQIVSMAEVDMALEAAFRETFGEAAALTPPPSMRATGS